MPGLTVGGSVRISGPMPGAQLLPRPGPSRWPQQAARVSRIAAGAGSGSQGLEPPETVHGPTAGGSVWISGPMPGAQLLPRPVSSRWLQRPARSPLNHQQGQRGHKEQKC